MPEGSANSSLVYFLGRFINLLLAPVAVILLPGILGQDGYGQYSYWFGLITVYIIAFDAGAQPMLRRFLPEMIQNTPQQSFSLFRMAMYLKLLILPLLIINSLVATDPGTLILLVLAALLASLATNLADVFYSYQRMGLHSVVVLSRRVFRLILVPLGFLQLGLVGILLALVVAEILGFVIALPAFRLFSKQKEKLVQPFSRYYRQGIVMFMAMFASIFIGRSPVFFAEWTGMEAELVGRVALCVDLSYFALKELVNAISESILPRLISLYAAGQLEKMKILIGQNYRIVNFFTLWFVGIGAGLSEPALKLLGEGFYLASRELCILLIMVIFSSWNLIHSQLLIIEEKSGIVFLSQCTGLIVSFTLVFMCRNNLTIQILVASLGMAMIASCLISYLAIRKKYNAKVQTKYLLTPFLAAFLVAVLFHSVDVTGVWQVLIAGVIGSAIYFGTVLICKGIHKEDLQLAVNLIPGRNQ